MIGVYKITDAPLSDSELDCGVQKITPIIGSSFSASHYFELIVNDYNETGRLLAPSELGCTLSHLKIYEKLIKNRENGIIFEADIVTTKNQIEIAIEICKKSDLDFIHLGWHPSTESGTFFKGKYDSQLQMFEVSPFNDFHGAFAYYVSGRLAKKLIAFHKDAIKPADAWAAFFQNCDVKPYFCPIFRHPPTRGLMESQRTKVSRSVISLNFKNLIFYFKKFFLRNFRYTPTYNNVTENFYEKELNKIKNQ